MKFRTKLAALIAAVALAAGFAVTDQLAMAQRTIPSQIKTSPTKVSKATTFDCTYYGSGCLGDWSGYSHGVDGNATTADVLVVGDSIVNICRPYLRLRLAQFGLTVVFDYWSSRPTADIPAVSSSPGAVTAALAYPRINGTGHYQAVAMLTGTNDIFNPPVMAAQIARIKGIDAPLLWGTVYASRSSSYSADLRNTGWVNEQIAASGVPMSDWFGFLAQYPGYRIPNHLTDGVHPDYNTPAAILDGSGCDSWAAIAAPRIAAVAS